MARWPGGARERLVGCAVELFAERGFAATTVDDVAAAAGVTQRTFFRHFRDKDEVLFDQDDGLLTVLLAGVRDAEGGPVDMLRATLRAVAVVLQPQRDTLRVRATIIATDIGLTGRELAKQARWVGAVSDALRARGYATDRADLMAHVGFAVFRHAMDGWLAVDSGATLARRVDNGIDELREVFCD